MANYKVIYKASSDESRLEWESGCPIQLTAIQISRNTESSEAYLQVKVRNISFEDVSSIYVDIEMKFADGTSQTSAVDYLDADVLAGIETALRSRRLQRADISSCSLKITRLDIASGTWKSSTAAQSIPKAKALDDLSSRALEQRARNIGATPDDPATMNVVQDYGDWWLCACGQPNVGREDCCKCKRAKETLLANENEQKLLANANAHDDAVFEEAVKLQTQNTIPSLKQAIEKFSSISEHENADERLRICKEQLNALKKQKRKRRKILQTVAGLIALVAILAAIILAVFVQPAMEKAAEEQRIEQEKTALTTAKAGDKISFGQYEQDGDELDGKEAITWKVLAVEDGKALLLSEKCLEYKQFNSSEVKKVSYETSDLCTWLKEDFTNTAFVNEWEQGALTEAPFCLSIDQVKTHLSSDNSSICYPTTSAANKKNTEATDWWLGSTDSNRIRYCNKIGNLTITSTGSKYQTYYKGVRPAIWVTLQQ